MWVTPQPPHPPTKWIEGPPHHPHNRNWRTPPPPTTLHLKDLLAPQNINSACTGALEHPTLFSIKTEMSAVPIVYWEEKAGGRWRITLAQIIPCITQGQASAGSRDSQKCNPGIFRDFQKPVFSGFHPLSLTIATCFETFYHCRST